MLLGVGRRQRRVGAGPRQDRYDLPQNWQSEHALRHGCGRIAKAIMSLGSSARRFCRSSSRRKSCTGASRPCYDMVRYTERASEGLAHHFAVESDELRLKTNVRGGPLSACLAHFHARRRRSS